MYSIDEIKQMSLDERKEVLKMRAALAKKKSAVVAGVKRIAKNGWNDFHKYQFATESDVKEGIRELLSDNGLTLDIELIEDHTQQMPNGWLSTVTMEFTLQDNDTGYMDIKKSKGQATDKGDKGLYKAYAGCIKYYLMNNFLIATGDDPEQGNDQEVMQGKDKQGSNKRNQKGKNQKQTPDKPGNKDQGQRGNSQPVQTTKRELEAKWRNLCGSAEGFEDWLKKQQSNHGYTYDQLNQWLVQKMKEQQDKRKQESNQEQKQEQQDPKTQIVPPNVQEVIEQGKTVTDVHDGTVYTPQGTKLIFE